MATNHCQQSISYFPWGSSCVKISAAAKPVAVAASQILQQSGFVEQARKVALAAVALLALNDLSSAKKNLRTGPEQRVKT